MTAFVRSPDGQSRLCSFHAHIMAVAHESGQCQVLGLRLYFAYAPGMELRQLRYFVAVAETGNISRAAQKIFLTRRRGRISTFDIRQSDCLRTVCGQEALKLGGLAHRAMDHRCRKCSPKCRMPRYEPSDRGA